MATHSAEEDAAIAQAERLDAAGRHNDAISILSRAAMDGGRRAKLLVGSRILIGDRAPLIGAKGGGLIEEAAREGEAEAAALLSVITAAGVFRTPNWNAALDWLQRAAELGDARSQGALRALAGASEGEDWAGLRAGLDPAWFTTAPEGRTVSEDPLIRSFPDFAGPEICAWLIETSRGRLQRATLYNAVSQAVEAHETRTNKAANFRLHDTDLVHTAVQSRMAAAARIPFSHLEAPAVLHYGVGEQITEHFDFVDPQLPDHDEQVARDGQRVVTFLLYLNDDYEGGETDFPRIKVSHRGAPGEGMFFVNALPGGKADVRTVHAGRPPSAGEKWVVSQFIRSRPALPGAPAGEYRHPSLG